MSPWALSLPDVFTSFLCFICFGLVLCGAFRFVAPDTTFVLSLLFLVIVSVNSTSALRPVVEEVLFVCTCANTWRSLAFMFLFCSWMGPPGCVVINPMARDGVGIRFIRSFSFQACSVGGMMFVCFGYVTTCTELCFIVFADGGFDVIATDLLGSDTLSSGMVCAAVVRTVNGDGGVSGSHMNGSKSHAAKVSSGMSGADTATVCIVGVMVGMRLCCLWGD